MKRLALFLIVLFAVLIGLYPLFYFWQENFGLLGIKEEAVRTSRVWLWAFYVHIVFGGLALLLGWLQFFKRFRPIHKQVGMAYLVFVVLGGVSGAYMALFASTGWIAATGFFGLALAWTGSTLLTYRFMRTGRYDLHEKAAIYSYALCFSAVTLRIWLPLLMFSLRDMNLAYPAVAWLCWVPNLLVALLITRKITGSFAVQV